MAERGLRAGSGGRGSRREAGGRRFAAALGAAALALAGCDGAKPATRFEVVHHLVGLAATTLEGDGPAQLRTLAPERAPSDPPRFEQVGDEARPVLRGFPLARSERRRGTPLDAHPEILGAVFPLPAEFAAYRRALVTAGALAGERWLLGLPRQSRLEPAGEAPRIEAHFPLARLAGLEARDPEGAWLRSQVRALPDAGFRRIQTAPMPVPRDAHLELGLGVLREAQEQGPVAFQLSACVADDCTLLLDERFDPTSARRWSDHSLSLSAFAGREVAFRFDSTHIGKGAFSLPVWSDPVVLAATAVGERPPNLVLVSLDTLRADRLPAYGYPRDTAPFLSERLARQGVVFERAFSAASTTGPSHMTAFTARTPSAHGLRNNIRKARLPPEIPTLAERLRAAGFATGAVTEDGALTFGSGIERGFQSYREFRPGGPVPHRAETTFAAAREWLTRHPSRPVLLFVHTYETHTPYRAPSDTPPLSGPVARLPDAYADLRLRDDWQPESYDREVRYLDQALRDFVQALEGDGILDDSLLVVFSDHGEAFLEHGYLHHGGGIHEEVLHVPLIFVGPGIAAGRRVSATVGLVDLLPTLLELLGLPEVPGVTGRSFAPLVRGDAADPGWTEQPLFSEAWADTRKDVVDGRIRKAKRRPPTLSVRLGTRKLIRETGADADRYHYYELATDPGEQRDLYAAEPERATELRRLLDDYARKARARPLPEEPLDPEQEDALRALGYLE